MNNTEINFHQFSPHLFWDIDSANIDFINNKKWLIQRVLEYGLLNDWLIIYKYYGIQEIANITMKVKNLDCKTASFIAVLSQIPKEKFLCYSTKQSNQKHWDF